MGSAYIRHVDGAFSPRGISCLKIMRPDIVLKETGTFMGQKMPVKKEKKNYKRCREIGKNVQNFTKQTILTQGIPQRRWRPISVA